MATRPHTVGQQEVRTELDVAAADLAAGRMRESFDRVKAELARQPDDPRALGLFGQIAVFMDQPGLGLGFLQRAVAIDPQPENRIWLSLCLAKLDCRDDAVHQVTTAIETMRPTANAHFAIGMVFHELGEYRQAADFYARCVALEPARSAAHHRRARALQAAGETERAVAAYLDAVQHCTTVAAYYADLSSALSDLGRFQDAYRTGKIAVELDPACVVCLNNLGHALQCLNRSAEALPHYEAAIELSANYAKARFGYAVTLLKNGDFARGWPEYEWRWRTCQTERHDLRVPVWRGQAARGQTILLHAEQGLGDTLQFIRFAPLVADRGCRVVLEVPLPLVRLLRGVAGVAEVIQAGDPLPPIDLHCPMASLPLALDLRLEAIPALPYLGIPDGKGTTRQPRINPLATTGRVAQMGLVVGLVWAGDPRRSEPWSNLIDRRRSTNLTAFAPLFEIGGVRFASFQHGEQRVQIASAGLPIEDAMADVTDFADTALRVAAIDLIISVDTSMVHLAGGMGMPVWMLSRFDGCWRWLERRDDTPWYPSMRIFRQPSPGDWPSVIADVAAALRQVVRGETDVYLRPLC